VGVSAEKTFRAGFPIHSSTCAEVQIRTEAVYVTTPKVRPDIPQDNVISGGVLGTGGDCALAGAATAVATVMTMSMPVLVPGIHEWSGFPLSRE
jgi:hypothetical protein